MKAFCVLLLTTMFAIVVQKSATEYLLVEIDHEAAIGKSFTFMVTYMYKIV